MLRIQLINKNMRLVGLTEDMIGKYVIADDWEVKEVIGEKWKGIAQSLKLKAIRVDYEKHEIKSYYDMKEDGFKNVIINERYDPKIGNHWGGELTLRLNENIFTWFLCTPATRELLHGLNDMLGREIIVSSTLIYTGRFEFYNPLIGVNNNVS